MVNEDFTEPIDIQNLPIIFDDVTPVESEPNAPAELLPNQLPKNRDEAKLLKEKLAKIKWRKGNFCPPLESRIS